MPQKGKNRSAFEAHIGSVLISTFFQINVKTHPTVGSHCQDPFNTLGSKAAQCRVLEILVCLH